MIAEVVGLTQSVEGKGILEYRAVGIDRIRK
jgi:hypothetical protein